MTGAGPLAPVSNRGDARQHSAHISQPLKPSPSSRQHRSKYLTALRAPPSTIGHGEYPRMGNLAPSYQEYTSEEVADAERWFDDSNRNVSGNNSALLFNDDPPFHLKRETSPILRTIHGLPLHFSHHARHNLPIRPNLSRMESSESSSEDFRSVIDDLTVENQRLKQKLRKYENLHCSHLQGDKLFEVRIHDLPASKRLELEETLRQFALSLGNTPEKPSPTVQQTPFSMLDRLSFAHEPASSSTSLSRPVDSTYASMSASGQTSVSNFHHLEKTNPARMTQGKSQNIKSYLHDIPEGLLPRQPPIMSDRAKKSMVVTRLERLFTGKDASTSRLGQSLQQQEVSQSAAKADRNAIEADGHEVAEEGVREARILPLNPELSTQLTSEDPLRPYRQTAPPSEELDGIETNMDGDSIPEQRPTRPLDLDPYRAQVPAENLDYIRHLGLDLPRTHSSSDSREVSGWVYLNLLFSMAQLHTTNVTLDFVRKAIVELSVSFELSEDGRKVRWRRDSVRTRPSHDKGSEAEQPTRKIDGDTYELDSRRFATFESNVSQAAMDDSFGNFTRNLTQSNELTLDLEVNIMSKPNASGQLRSNNNFTYKPLIFHGVKPQEEEAYYLHGDDSLVSSGPAEVISRTGSACNTPPKSDLVLDSAGRRRGDGPIIFYDRAKFCTDLSGDQIGSRWDIVAYAKFTEHVLGSTPFNEVKHDNRHSNCSGLSAENELSLENVIADDDSEPANAVSGLEAMQATDVENDLDPVEPKCLEAFGIGGVRPHDNFVIDVRVRHSPHDRSSAPQNSSFSSPRLRVHRLMRDSSQNFVNAHGAGSVTNITQFCHPITSEVLSTKTSALAPSSLPPPSYVFCPFSSSENGEDGRFEYSTSDGNSSEKSSSMDMGPGELPDFDRKLSTNISREESSGSSCRVSDGSSIDLLAHARELDPDTIAAREREFDSNLGQAFAEQIPAGSSAATAGGGSGIPSSEENATSEASSIVMGFDGAVIHRALFSSSDVDSNHE